MEPEGALPSSPRACPNCGGPAPERFCPACGQEQRSLRVPFHRVVAEGLDEAFSLDSRLAQTLPALFLRPGDASRAWREGRRASHTSPTKLYLLASFLFFFAIAVGPDFGLRAGRSGVNVGPAPQAGDGGPAGASEAELAELRAAGGIQAMLAEHLERLQRLPPEEAQRRLNAVFIDNSAKAMFAIVPLAALALLVLHARRGFYYTEHLVFTAHAQTVTFVLLTPGVATANGVVAGLGALAACAHLLVGLRRFYGTGWLGAGVRWTVLSACYLLLLVVMVAGSAIVAVLTS